MKKHKGLFLIIFSLGNVLMAQYGQTYNLDEFDKINISGNVEVHLIESNEHSFELQGKKNDDYKKYAIEVQNGELFIQKQENIAGKDDKLKLNVKHTGIKKLDVSGMVKVSSHDVLRRDKLEINGSGMIRGKIKVDVKTLQMGLSGMSNMEVSGKAEKAILNASGMGKITAEGLVTIDIQKSANGFARIKTKKQH